MLFKGAAKQWPCAGKWNMDFFKEGALGDTKINVSLDGKVPLPQLARYPCVCHSLPSSLSLSLSVFLALDILLSSLIPFLSVSVHLFLQSVYVHIVRFCKTSTCPPLHLIVL